MSQNESAQPKPATPINEELLFDGSPSWIGRFKAFALTWLIATVLFVTPIISMINFPGFPWWLVAIGIVAALLLVAAQVAFHNTIRYRITSYRIDFERGLLTRRIDSMELWHAEDLFFKQTLLQRMLGVGCIDVISHDQSSPRLELVAVPDARNLFDRLKSCILAAKRQRGILELDH